MGDNLTLYMKYWRPFGELLTDMERRGFKIDIEYLQSCQLKAEKDSKDAQDKFLNWVYSTQEDAADFNASSVTQMQHLLFAPYNIQPSKKTQQKQPKRDFEDIDGLYEKEEDFSVNQEEFFRVENNSGWVEPGKDRPLKYRQMKIKGFGLMPISYTEGGLPQADNIVIRTLAGKNPSQGKYGTAYE
jgi:DNA polymerase-1